jgi:dihydroflavonol-4-reductase
MILVTGATGLVGSYLLHALLLKGLKVRSLLYNRKSLDRTRVIFTSLGSNAEELIKKVEWIEGDVLDVSALLEAMQGVDQVYHCAAIVSFDPGDRNLMMKVNVEGTANVVNTALEAGVSKLCHVSSIASLGRSEESNIIDEKSEWRNTSYNSRYSKSKYLAEREVWRASAEGLPVIIVNPAIILGYGHPGKGSTKLFKTIHKTSLFYGKGTNGYVDVQDVVKAMISLMDSEIVNERFVISAGSYTYKHIFGLIAQGFNKPSPRIEVPDLVLEVVWRFEAIRSALTRNKPLITKETATTSKGNYYYSSEKLINTLNFKYIPIEETIGSICKVIENELNGKPNSKS